jgi:CheY-like chemotaxis protein
MMLQRLGYNICTARAVDEAIEFMCVAPPSGILAEAGPTGSGLLVRIKKDRRFSDVPLILLSAPDRALEERARRGEFAACLRKPVDVEELYRAVESVIEKGPRRNIRIATNLRANMENQGAGSDGSVTVISEYGMFFRTLDPLPMNTRISLSLDIKGRTIKLDAVVLYSCSVDDGPFKEPGMGLKFARIAPADQDHVRQFIREELTRGIAPDKR